MTQTEPIPALEAAMDFAIDYQQGEGHGAKELGDLIKKYEGKHAMINERVVITFPDLSKALSAQHGGGWEIKKSCIAIDFIFGFLNLEKYDQTSFQNLVEKHGVIDKVNGVTLVFPDKSKATWQEESNSWTFE